MFKLAQIIGDGLEQNLTTFGVDKEGTIHSILINNNSGTPQVLVFVVGSINIQYPIDATEIQKIDIGINIPVDTAVNLTVPTGVIATISYIELPAT